MIDSPSDHDALRKAVFTELLSWTEEEGVSKIVGGDVNRLVYNYSFLSLYLLSELSCPYYRMLHIRLRT